MVVVDMRTSRLSPCASRSVHLPRRAPLSSLSRSSRTNTRVTRLRRRAENGSGSENPVTLALREGSLPRKLTSVLGLLALVRTGQYLPVPGLNPDSISAAMGAKAGVLEGMQQALTGGGVAQFGILSLGIIPAINSSIAMQLFTVIWPDIKKLLKEEGEAGRRKYLQYQRLLTLAFAVLQAFPQALNFRQYATDFSYEWAVLTTITLVCGAIVTMFVSEVIDEYKVGNGSSLLIFMNILSSLPTSIAASVTGSTSGSTAVASALFAVAVLTCGIVYVQEAERKLPLNYAQQYTTTTLSLQRESYLPLKINSSGVMPIILASSMLSVPAVLGNFIKAEWITKVAIGLGPQSVLHLPVEIALIAYFNSFYTFLQLDPKDVSENLQRSGASLVGVRPGKATAQELQETLERLTVLGGVFLALLAVTPTAIESATGVPIFRGFTGTSLLILVGVATDVARKVRSELLMQKFEDVDSLYDNMKL